MRFPAAFKTYLDNSSVHGFPHITNQNKSLAERGFWAVICLLAGYATWGLLQVSLHTYKNKAVSFIVDTDYLRFNTTFPSLSVCETDSNFEAIKLAGEKIYGPERDLSIDKFIREIAFYDGTCGTCSSLCQNSLNCSGDLSYITKRTRSPCSHLMTNCSWNEQPFDCCSYFLPLQTEFGVCFSINSANTVRTQQTPKLLFSLNRTTGPGKVVFSTKEKLNLYLHSIDDVPTINHPKLEKMFVSKNRRGSEVQWVFKIKEIYNDPLLKTLPLQQRDCRFPEEKILQAYNTYSYSGCSVECRALHQERLCNCTHHLMPKMSGVKTCDLDGIICLSKYSNELRNPHTIHLLCNCTANCVEPDFNVISLRTIANLAKYEARQTPEVTEILLVELRDAGNEESEQKYRKITVKMDSLPHLRLKRVVVRTKFDLVVSMGSTIGLFLGASLLSSVEIVYFFFIRKRRPIKTVTDKLKSKLPARAIMMEYCE